MTKPTGSVCNLDCDYSYFLSKEELYPGSGFRMPPDVHGAGGSAGGDPLAR